MEKQFKLPEIKSIRFEQISLAYPGQDPIFMNADFDFPVNEVVWLKSPEGGGKSTLLQILAGLQEPNSGKYFINDQDVLEMSFEEFLPYRLNIGYTFDYGGLINNRTILDNLYLPLTYHKIVDAKEAHNRVNEVLKAFDLKKYLQERPAHVPGRIRKLVCLLRPLLMRPQLLLLDDPSVGLGQETLYQYVDYVQKLKKDGCLDHIFVSSYDEKFMSQFDYQVMHLSDGQLYLQQKDEMKKVVHL